MLRSTERITHVVQAVKEGYQVEVLAGEILGRSHFKLRVCRQPVLLSMRPRCLYGCLLYTSRCV